MHCDMLQPVKPRIKLTHQNVPTSRRPLGLSVKPLSGGIDAIEQRHTHTQEMERHTQNDRFFSDLFWRNRSYGTSRIMISGFYAALASCRLCFDLCGLVETTSCAARFPATTAPSR